MEENVKQKIEELFDTLSTEEKNVIVTKHLCSLSRWDFKRILCAVLNVDNYMDDAGLQKKFKKVIFER